MRIGSVFRNLAASLILAGGSQAAMAAFPERPVTLIVTYSAGGEADVQMRIVGKYLEKEFGVPFIVKNVVGAGGQIGWDKVARDEPDGYTWVNYNLPQIVVQPMVRHTNYSPDSFEPLILFRDDPSVLAVRNDDSITLKGLVAEARKEPGKVPIATTAKWTQHDLSFQYFQNAAKAKFIQIPVDGQAEVNLMLLGKDVRAGFGNLSAFYRLRDQYKVIGVAAKKRSEILPNAPTFAEEGFPGVLSSVVMGIAVAKGTDPKLVKELSERLHHMFETNAALRKDLERAGAPPVVFNREEEKKVIAETEKTISGNFRK